MSEPHSWPAELDALTAAPYNHTLLFENDSVRVLDTKVRAGDQVPLHTHRWPSTNYLLAWSNFIRRDAKGTILLDSRTVTGPTEGSAFWSPPFPPHTLENIGTTDLRVISVELKNGTQQ